MIHKKMFILLFLLKLPLYSIERLSQQDLANIKESTKDKKFYIPDSVFKNDDIFARYVAQILQKQETFKKKIAKHMKYTVSENKYFFFKTQVNDWIAQINSNTYLSSNDYYSLKNNLEKGEKLSPVQVIQIQSTLKIRKQIIEEGSSPEEEEIIAEEVRPLNYIQRRKKPLRKCKATTLKNIIKHT